MHRRRAAGKNYTLYTFIRCREMIEGINLTLYIYLPDPSGYELCILRTEIEYEDLFVHFTSIFEKTKYNNLS